MPHRVFLITALALLVTFKVARASDDEIREKKAIFILDNFQQSANLKYQFNDQSSSEGTQSSYSHQFLENYNGLVALSIINPHVFNTGLNFSLGMEQNMFYNSGQGSSSGNSFRYNYQFSGNGLDRSITPFSITSYRNTETVVSPFSPTYTSDSTGNEFTVTLRNIFLPSTFTYSRRSIDNSGGGNDSSSTSNSFTYQASHAYRSLSLSALTLNLSDSTGSFSGDKGQTSRAYAAALSNTLIWGPSEKYKVTSVFQFYDMQSQDIPQRTVSLSESFQDHLGKALDLLVNYTLSDSSTRDFTGQKSDLYVNSGEVQLTHRLFQSVTTKLKGRYSYNELLKGTETRYSGVGDIAYKKILPGENHLNINMVGIHEVTDNDVGGTTFTVTNESHPGVHQGDIISLPVTTGVLQAVLVKSETLTYTEGVDYTVDYTFAQITVVRGGRIDRSGAGADLLISYSVSLAPKIKYASDSFNVGGSMTFKQGRYSVGAAYATTHMTPLDGTLTNTLRDSSLLMVYFNGTYDPLTYRVSYTDNTVGDLTARTFEGSAQYYRDTVLGRFSLVGNDRYSWYNATETTPSYIENTATLSLVGIRNLSYNARLTMSANLYDSRSDIRGPKDIVSLRASLLYVLNKMTITMDGQTSWHFSGSNTTRDDTVTVDFARFF